ncbi:MAG: HDOD domain-containing protein [Deltaproteobacteria bacterium]|nr:HDOD domain-containing protein [Deltaproteobacteria bacterium]
MDAEKQCPGCNTVNPPHMRFCGACGLHLAVQVTTRRQGDPLLGALVGNRFVILEKIAQGGMGVVYRAEQTAIWRTVALKVLRPKFIEDQTLLTRFRNEASTASRLTHPNTITIYDFGVLDDHGLYIAMEFIEGAGLDALIKKKGALDWRRACRIAIQICGSLDEAHENNIVHRDLKPENIMLTHRGAESDFAKVLDFGIAKIMAVEGEAGRPSLTARDEIFGTPDYMAPEQIRSEQLDRRTDIYALGVILYHMMTGKMPFVAEAPLALLAKHLMEPPLPFDTHGLDLQVPHALEAIIMSCLSKNQTDRPKSMRVVADQLLVLLDGSPRVRATSIRVAAEPASSQAGISDAAPEPHPIEEGDKTDTTAVLARDKLAVEKALSGIVEAQGSKEEQDPADDDSDWEEDWDSDEEADEEADTEEEPSVVDGEKRTKKETTLETLLAKMKKNRDFPAMSHNITELNTKASRENTSASQLANVILRDYGLTSKLLKLVNSPFYGQYRGRVMTVSRAVVIMGFEQVRQIALSLMMFDRLKTKDRHQTQALLDTALGSLMSGLVAKGVAKETGKVQDEEALVCAMYRNLGKYICYYYLPKESREIRRLIKKKGKSEDDASMRVLGMTLSQLGQIMAEKWEFPEQIQYSMNALPKGRVPKARGNLEALRNLSGLADELTKIASESKPSRREAALKKLALRFKDSFPISDKQLQGIVHEATQEIRDYSKILDLSLLDSRFIHRVLRWSGVTELEPSARKRVLVSEFPELDGMEPPPTAAKEPRMDQLKERTQVLVSGTEEVAMAMTGPYDLNSLIMMVIETMYRGLGLSRVIFCLHDVKSNMMIARSGFGDGVDDMMKHFRFRPMHGRDLFNHSVMRGADVIVPDTQDSRYAGKLPAWFRRIAEPPVILIYPVMVRNFPAGLFYGDIVDKKKMVNRGLLVHMDKLRNQAARAIREKGTTG